MKIHSIGIKNLNSLKLETKIALDKAPISTSGLFAITGATGSGKTTILDAISLALYGRVHRNKDVKEVVSFGATESYAEVEFSANEGLYRAKWNVWKARGKADGNILGPNRELAKWNPDKNEFEIIAEKIREVDELVEKITGLDYDRFSRSVVLSQGDFAAFLKAGEKERSDLLERITGTEIYSQLSQAAFEKHKEEKEKLDELRKDIENLKILDPEEVKALRLSKKQKSEAAKSQKKAIDELSKKMQRFENLQKLTTRKEFLESNLQKIESEKEAFRTEQDRLLLHQKTTPFQAKIEKTEELTEQINSDNQHLAELQTTATALDKQLQASKNQQKVVQQDFSVLKKEWSEKSVLLDQIIELDTTIKSNEIPLQKSIAQLQSLTGLLEQKVQKQELTKTEIEALKKNKSESEQWLKKNDRLKSIVEELPVINQHYTTLRVEYQKKENAKKSKAQLLKQIEDLEKQKSKLLTSIESATQERTKLLEEFKKNVPEYFVESRNEMLNKMTSDIDQLNANNENLEKLKIFNEQYMSLLNELNDYEAKQKNLEQEEEEINKRVMTAMEAMDALQLRLDYKLQIYEQQQLIANYEKDRSQLEDGQPCPLCFSKTHPFREKQFKPFVDEASKELKLVKAQYELMNKDYKKLLNRQSDLKGQIENLAGNEVRALSGEVQKQVDKIIQFEAKMMSLAPGLEVHDFAIARQSSLNLKISTLKKQLETLKSSRQKLIKLDETLEKQELLSKSQQQKQSALELDLIRLKEQQKLLVSQQKEATEEFDQQVKALNKILKKYDKIFDIESGKETRAALEKLKIDFETRQQQQLDLKSKLELALQESGQLSTQIADLKTQVQQLETEIKSAQLELNALKEQRIEQFGENDTKDFKTAFQVKLETAEKQVNTAVDQTNTLQLQLQTISTQQTGLLKQLERQQTQLEKLNSELSDRIAKSGFSSVQALKAAVLPEAEAKAIQAKIEQFNIQEIETRQDLKTTIADLEKTKQENATALDKTDQKVLAEQLEVYEKLYQENQQQIGAINEKLNQNDERKAESQSLVEAMENQRKEFNRWAKLNDIIGQADGKKFRVFAQGLTLKKLTVLANHHLQDLNGRYYIHKRSDEDLSLEIIDTYQADNIRSMNTLSGGESFLVSLSLALGLSDLAGRNTTIRSLFIDEGFGTLDESTLDLAISTLENLQSSGKTIGIISHVKELKERITTQIVIQKSGSGFSQIQIIG